MPNIKILFQVTIAILSVTTATNAIHKRPSIIFDKAINIERSPYVDNAMREPGPNYFSYTYSGLDPSVKEYIRYQKREIRQDGAECNKTDEFSEKCNQYLKVLPIDMSQYDDRRVRVSTNDTEKNETKPITKRSVQNNQTVTIKKNKISDHQVQVLNVTEKRVKHNNINKTENIKTPSHNKTTSDDDEIYQLMTLLSNTLKRMTKQHRNIRKIERKMRRFEKVYSNRQNSTAKDSLEHLKESFKNVLIKFNADHLALETQIKQLNTKLNHFKKQKQQKTELKHDIQSLIKTQNEEINKTQIELDNLTKDLIRKRLNQMQFLKKKSNETKLKKVEFKPKIAVTKAFPVNKNITVKKSVPLNKYVTVNNNVTKTVSSNSTERNTTKMIPKIITEISKRTKRYIKRHSKKSKKKAVHENDVFNDAKINIIPRGKDMRTTPYYKMAEGFCVEMGMNSTEQIMNWCIEKSIRRLQNIDIHVPVPFLKQASTESPITPIATPKHVATTEKINSVAPIFTALKLSPPKPLFNFVSMNLSTKSEVDNTTKASFTPLPYTMEDVDIDEKIRAFEYKKDIEGNFYYDKV